jgi:integrase
MEDLVENLKKRNLSDSSIKLYMRNLIKLNDDVPPKNLNFLMKTDDILQKLEKYKDNTKRGYLISIVSILSTVKDTSKKMLKIFKFYYDEMMKINTTLKEKPTDEMSKQQGENWVKWDFVIDVRDKLHEEVKTFVNNKTLTNSQYNKLLNLVVLSCYTYNSPRRNKDYSIMNITNEYSDALPKDLNYLDFNNKKFIFNVYKTSKKEEGVSTDIPNELMLIIIDYLKHHPVLGKKKLPKKFNTRFLVYSDGSDFGADNSITRILNTIFKPKKVSSSMLRHIYLTDKYGDTLQQMKEDSKEMSHNMTTQKDYIKDESKI